MHNIYIVSLSNLLYYWIKFKVSETMHTDISSIMKNNIIPKDYKLEA